MASDSPPSSWITRFSAQANGPVLDVACGSGRHTRLFLELGHDVTAVDRDTSRLGDIARHPKLTILETDLENDTDPWRPAAATYGAVVVTNYLWRSLLPALVDAVAPGGMLLYETFAQGNERFGKPSNPDFLLAPDELKDAVAGKLDVVAYEQGDVTEPRPAVIQRICGLKGL
ncbi:MAG: class I SAM-dependent methyltransferase [Rhodospirillaceae bacterium]|jgi:SAM-dependent methyltransferase|nr:class I SAM-dependent methyltransferase [Rhodospirillaceae bacterium]MBT5943781.1 class I SAM-dependent methyltransferase [Rhodospirillaceae bacterium]MBT6404491.1 class I SAM-dependent methyltransferase [Rhodospirillaceae bacterium]MBT6535255.1 class I SAM-dependent methyltransferase [Rhodospirillaceae bacterium]MBT7363050.1 class I SAM-dependent methyltransferase [Rhodospirillaceae bacterium]